MPTRTQGWWFRLAGLGLAAVILGGCATQQRSASVYRSHEAQREQLVRFGTVEGVREVVMDRGTTGVGTGTGAVIGGIAGSTMGGGSGQAVAAVLGAVLGGVAGQAIETNNSKIPALEITVQLENGELRAIVQEIDGQLFRPGDPVRLLSQGGVTRVTR